MTKKILTYPCNLPGGIRELTEEQIKTLEERRLSLEQRVTRIEKHIGIPVLQASDKDFLKNIK